MFWILFLVRFSSVPYFFLPARTEFGEIALRNISFPIFAPLPPFTITFLCYLIGYRFSRYFLLRFLVGIATTCYYPCLTVVRASHAHTHISCYVRKSCHSSMRAGLERYDGNKIYTAGLFPPTFLLWIFVLSTYNCYFQRSLLSEILIFQSLSATWLGVFYQHTHTHTHIHTHKYLRCFFLFALTLTRPNFFRTPLRERNFIRRGNVDTDKIDIKLKGCSSNFFFFFTRSPFRSNQQTKNKNDVTRSQNTLYINSKYICFGLLRSVPTTHRIQDTGRTYFSREEKMCAVFLPTLTLTMYSLIHCLLYPPPFFLSFSSMPVSFFSFWLSV